MCAVWALLHITPSSHTHTHTHTRIHAHAHAHAHAYAPHTYTHTYIYTHTYTYSHTLPSCVTDGDVGAVVLAATTATPVASIVTSSSSYHSEVPVSTTPDTKQYAHHARARTNARTRMPLRFTSPPQKKQSATSSFISLTVLSILFSSWHIKLQSRNAKHKSKVRQLKRKAGNT
jgi:hypothetical protein